jgi:hypothetical protein
VVIYTHRGKAPINGGIIMKAFDVLYCFFDSYGRWKHLRIYGVDYEDALARARKDAVDSGITGGLYFK